MKHETVSINELLLIFFNGDATKEEKDEILAWMNESEENVEKSLQLYKKWMEAKRKEHIFDASEGWQRFEKNLNTGKRARFARLQYVVGGIAAVIILLVGMFIFNKIGGSGMDIEEFACRTVHSDFNGNDVKLVLSADSTLALNGKTANVTYQNGKIIVNNQAVSGDASAEYNELIVPYGHSSNITLADGTRIWLNAGTRMVYPKEFSGDRREVYVEGEIYLEVKHDEEHPFIVKTSRDMEVKVLGTKFDVKAYANDPLQRVVLVSGSVVVDQQQRARQAHLKPCEMFEAQGATAYVKHVDPCNYVSWVSSLLMSDDEPLCEILNSLERYYGVQISYSSSVSSLRCSGKIDLNKDIDEVMDLISLTAPIKYTKSNNQYKINLK